MASPEPVATFKKRKAKANVRKRAPAASDSDDSSSESDHRTNGDEGHRTKRRKKAVVAASSKDAAVHSDWGVAPVAVDRGAAITDSNDATKGVDWYEYVHRDTSKDATKDARKEATERIDWYEHVHSDTGRDAATKQSDREKKQRNWEDADSSKASTTAAASTATASPAAGRQGRMVGPVRATNVRTVTVTDFAPDVCKDYKTTGFCGFGDSCKFLHAREDYKQGWQLDREWETVTKGRKNLGGTVVASADRSGRANDEDDADRSSKTTDEAGQGLDMFRDIPWACVICKNRYKAPVVTRCGHYFCEACALDRYRRDPSCAACGAGTGGVFNVAVKLRERMRETKELRKKYSGRRVNQTVPGGVQGGWGVAVSGEPPHGVAGT